MTSWACSTEVQGKVGLTPVYNWLCDLSLHAESESAGGTYCLAGKCPGGNGPHFPTVALEEQVYPAPSFGGRQATATSRRPEAPITLQSFDLTLKRIANAPQNKRPRSQHATSQPPSPGGSLATPAGTLSIGPACPRPTLRAVEAPRFATGWRQEKPLTMSTRQAALLVFPRSIEREICGMEARLTGPRTGRFIAAPSSSPSTGPSIGLSGAAKLCIFARFSRRTAMSRTLDNSGSDTSNTHRPHGVTDSPRTGASEGD